MLAGEAITKLAIIVKGIISEDGVSHAFVQSTYSPSADHTFVLINGKSFCGTDIDLAQAYKLMGIDW